MPESVNCQSRELPESARRPRSAHDQRRLHARVKVAEIAERPRRRSDRVPDANAAMWNAGVPESTS